MTNNIVQAQGLCRRFGRHEALRGLNFSVPEGSVYALIGANGAGKTTAVKILVNLIEPMQGTATIMDADSRTLPPTVLAQIGYVAENQVLPGRLRIRDYFDYLRGFYPSWDGALEASLRDRLQLPAERRIGALSHGMRIKVALAAALVYRPRLLILDEPFAGLDVLVRDELMESLLQQAGELTVLVTSHDFGEIEGVTTHVGFMHDGRMLLEEHMADLGSRLREVRVTLEQPARVPEPWPREWLEARTFGNVLTFIDTRHAPETFGERVRSVLGPVRQIDAVPMPLRAQFGVIERAARAGVTA